MDIEKIKIGCFFILSVLIFLSDTDAAEDDNFMSNGIMLDNIRGLIKPVESATISSEITGKINKIPFSVGESFKKGDLLVGFDCSYYRADLTSASAALQSKKNIYENNKQLLALNAISDIEVSISKSEMKIAQANRTMRALKVRQCKINAPYNGRVIEVTINEHETVPVDKEILSILNDSDLKIELIVPSNWLNWLKIGERFHFLIDETGSTFKAKVIQIGAIVDPVSQTIKLIGKFDDSPKNVLSGMSGTAKFKTID